MCTVSGHLGSGSFRLEDRFPDLRDSLDKIRRTHAGVLPYTDDAYCAGLVAG